MFSACLDASVNKAIFKIKSDNQPLTILSFVNKLHNIPLLQFCWKFFILTYANHYMLASMYEHERVSSSNRFLNFTIWMTMFSPSLSKGILPPSPSHLKDVSTIPILLLPTIILIFLLWVGTKPDFQVLKKRIVLLL